MPNLHEQESYKRWLKTDNGRAYTAKNLRYKKAALHMMCLEDITEELYAIQNECDEIKYFMEDDETLTAGMDDDEEGYQFRVLFADLSAKCYRLDEALRDAYVSEHFDDYLVGMLGDRFRVIGYDGYQEDYYNLTSFEAGLAKTESGKRVMRLTKEQVLATCGQCLGIVLSFLDVRHSFDYLKASFDILKDHNLAVLNAIKSVDKLYQLASEDERYGEYDSRFERYLSELPDEVWVSA
jgi:hypothetical protein